MGILLGQKSLLNNTMLPDSEIVFTLL